MEREALYYKKENNKVICQLCNHNCVLSNNKVGICQSRKNINGVLQSLNYGKVAAYNIETVEKKPLYHFYPGSSVVSLGTCNCNYKCGFCINWEISQSNTGYAEVMPNEVIKMCEDTNNCIGVCFSFNEPTIWYEYVYDTSKILKENNLKSIIVTNGSIQTEPLKKLSEVTDAYLINLKSFSNSVMKEYAGNITKEIIIENIKLLVSLGKHVELTYLVIPEFNDSLRDINSFIKTIAKISPEIPVHFLKYHPAYNFSQSPTSIEFLKLVKNLALKFLKYVYIDNTTDFIESATHCKTCNEILIKRECYISSPVNLKSLKTNKCSKCQTINDIII